jgi:hypothetical protein
MDNSWKKHFMMQAIIITSAVCAGVITAKIFSDKDTRRKMQDVIKKISKKGEDVLTNIKDNKDEVVQKVVQKFEELKQSIGNSKEAQSLQTEIKAISDIVEEIKNSNQQASIKLIEQIKSSTAKLKHDFAELQKK